jgi:hypothetical protein
MNGRPFFFGPTRRYLGSSGPLFPEIDIRPTWHPSVLNPVPPIGPPQAALNTQIFLYLYLKALQAVTFLQLIMPKGAASKDKKPAEKKGGDKGKGKPEEAADKGGKVRSVPVWTALFTPCRSIAVFRVKVG